MLPANKELVGVSLHYALQLILIQYNSTLELDTINDMISAKASNVTAEVCILLSLAAVFCKIVNLGYSEI